MPEQEMRIQIHHIPAASGQQGHLQGYQRQSRGLRDGRARIHPGLPAAPVCAFHALHYIHLAGVLGRQKLKNRKIPGMDRNPLRNHRGYPHQRPRRRERPKTHCGTCSS